MKLNQLKGLFFLAALHVSASLNAAPVYYTFSGNVTEVGDGSGYVPADIFVGASVEYVYLIDFDSAGTVTRTEAEGPVNTILTHNFSSFYVDLISGNYMDATYPNIWSQYIEQNYGRNTVSYGYYKGDLIWGPSAATQSITSGYGAADNAVQYWGVGKIVTGKEEAKHATDATIPASYFNSRLTLTQITSYDPTVVPVPAAVWLFGSGLIGLIGLARRKKNNI